MTSSNRLPPSEPDIQMRSLWAGVRRGLTPLLFTTALVGASTYGALSLMAQRFTSEAQLAIVAKSTNPFPDSRTGSESNTPRLDKEAVNTHARALMAPDLLLKVANELKLRDRPEFNSERGNVDTWTALMNLIGVGASRVGETEEDRVLGVVGRQLDVVAAKESRFIPIRFTATEPQLAADFANRLAETYRASLVTAPVEETTAVVKALLPKVEALRKEVLDAESEVERFRSKTDQFRSGSQSTPVNDQRMAALNDELIKAEAAKSEAEARWRTARELMQSGSAEVVPDVQKSPLIQGLVNQRVRLERQLAETSATLLPGHPRMQQLNADLAGLKRQITVEVQKVVQGLEKDVAAVALKVDGVNRQLGTLKTKVVDQSGNEANLKSLDSIAKSKRVELERLQKQLEDNRTVVNTRQVPVEAQLISRARPNTTPTFPKKGSTTMLAMAASMILGLAVLITRGLIKAPTQQTDGPGSGRVAPTLSVAGTQKAGNEARAAPRKPAAGALTGVAPAVADLVARLCSRTDMKTGIRTLVTSEEPGVDVSSHAVAFAEALAETGKSVVLVVWSLTGQGVAIARAPLRKPGFNDLLLGRTTFEQVVGRIPGSDVHVIQPGAQPEDAQIALDPDRLNLVLDALDEAYEQIVVAGGLADAAPLFEAIEGRFDAAVVVGSSDAPVAARGAGSRLLGFEVSEIDIVHIGQDAAGHDEAAGVVASATSNPVRRLASRSAGAALRTEPAA